MGTREDVNRVKKNISDTFLRRHAAVFALASKWSSESKKYFDDVQNTGINNPGKFWHNRLNQAAQRWFSVPFIDGQEVGYRLAQGIEYGVYLELANDRRNESIRPILKRYAPRFIRDVQGLYSG